MDHEDQSPPNLRHGDALLHIQGHSSTVQAQQSCPGSEMCGKSLCAGAQTKSPGENEIIRENLDLLADVSCNLWSGLLNQRDRRSDTFSQLLKIIEGSNVGASVRPPTLGKQL